MALSSFSAADESDGVALMSAQETRLSLARVLRGERGGGQRTTEIGGKGNDK